MWNDMVLPTWHGQNHHRTAINKWVQTNKYKEYKKDKISIIPPTFLQKIDRGASTEYYPRQCGRFS